jgi:hypothetical protein
VIDVLAEKSIGSLSVKDPHPLDPQGLRRHWDLHRSHPA